MEGNRSWEWDSWQNLKLFERHGEYDGSTQESEEQMGCDEIENGWLWSLSL